MKLIKIYRRVLNILTFSLLIALISGCTERIDIYENNGGEDYSVKYDFFNAVNKNCIRINDGDYKIINNSSTCESRNTYEMNGVVKINLGKRKILEGYLYYKDDSLISPMLFFSVHKSSAFKILCYDKQRLSEIDYGYQFIDCELYKALSGNDNVNETLLRRGRNVVMRFRVIRE